MREKENRNEKATRAQYQLVNLGKGNTLKFFVIYLKLSYLFPNKYLNKGVGINSM